MVYAFLKPIVRFAIWLYYRSRQREALEKIDAGGPLLILANHTASFMDALVVAVHIRRKLHCYARGDVFGKPRVDRFLRAIGLLPVYRMSEGKENFAKNDVTNEEGIRILREGGVLLIFAEGSSDTAKILKPLKKGPFRLALAAAEALGKPLPVLPLGINYSDATIPGATVWIRAGAPFPVQAAPEEELPKAALSLLRTTTAALEPLVLDAGSKERAAAAAAEITIRERELGRPLEWMEARAITDAAKMDQPPLIPHTNGAKRSHLERRAGLLLLPLALPGRIFHALPLAITGAIVRQKVTEPDFISAVFLTLALLLTVLWYVVWAVALAIVNPVLLLLLPVTGLSGILWVKMVAPAWQDIFNRKS